MGRRRAWLPEAPAATRDVFLLCVCRMPRLATAGGTSRERTRFCERLSGRRTCRHLHGRGAIGDSHPTSVTSGGCCVGRRLRGRGGRLGHAPRPGRGGRPCSPPVTVLVLHQVAAKTQFVRFGGGRRWVGQVRTFYFVFLEASQARGR